MEKNDDPTASSMFSSIISSCDPSSFVHDITFDSYGKRFATCYSDRRIQIYAQSNATAAWQLDAEMANAHDGLIYKISWSDAEFGSLLATCSFDRKVKLWSPNPESDGGHSHANANANANANATLSSSSPSVLPWSKMATLVDAKESVMTVAFAPSHLGLKLASGSLDGQVRLYDAPDGLDFTTWTLQEEFLADAQGVTCLAWNTNRFDPPMLVIGGDATGCHVWLFHPSRHCWLDVCVLGTPTGMLDVSWAPAIGRAYHLIASVSTDSMLRIYKVAPNGRDGTTYDVACVLSHPSTTGLLTRVEWNVLGSTLAVSGDEGKVTLWKAAFDGSWHAVSVIEGAP